MANALPVIRPQPTGDGQTSQTCRVLNEDAKRFQAWQLAALEQHPAGTELVSFGPFRALLPVANQPGAWVTIVEGTVDERQTARAVAGLRSVFKQRNAELEIEYNEALYPRVGSWLEAAGLTFAERNPLMACRPDGFRSVSAPGVTVHRLTTASDTADLEAFQTLRWTNGRDDDPAGAPVDALRSDLASATSVYLLALIDGERAGTGVSHGLRRPPRSLGAVTPCHKRRLGATTPFTTVLAAPHFSS